MLCIQRRRSSQSPQSITTTHKHNIGRGVFSVRKAVLGHLQQGGEPSPRDRIRATAMATYTIEYFEKSLQTSGGEERKAALESVCVGERDGNTVSTPLSSIPSIIDAKARRPADQWWMAQHNTFSLLSLPPDTGSHN